MPPAALKNVSDVAVVLLTAIEVLSWMLLIFFIVWLTGSKLKFWVWIIMFVVFYSIAYFVGGHDMNRKIIMDYQANS